MYKVYTTKAIILSARSRKEADRMYVAYTKKIGLVRIHARSIRKESSKNRYGVQLFSQVTLSLVSGKGGWRLVGVKDPNAEKTESFSFSQRARIARILQQSLAYENPDPELYDLVSYSWNDLAGEERFQFLARNIIFHLGLADPAQEDFKVVMQQARISLGNVWSF